MQNALSLEQINGIQRLLDPYIKRVQDAKRIRRVLALHLNSHVDSKGEASILQPLSLLESYGEVTSSGLRGIRREYAHCVEANIKARDEYKKARKEHNIHGTSEAPTGFEEGPGRSEDSLRSFLDVVKHQRKHERLRVLQDYVDILAQKPAAASNHLDPGVVLNGVDPLPAVPSNVMSGIAPRQQLERKDLSELVNQLEKSVLRAKLLLKREQKLLSKFQAEGSSARPSAGSRLQALGIARNELINWIETELANAGESTANSSSQHVQITEGRGNDYIDIQLSLIQRQYAQYTKSREALIGAATELLDGPARMPNQDDTTILASKEKFKKSSNMSHILRPYLEDLTLVSNKQKSAIQQKSYLTITLSKQLKESGQGLDRLAEESHLLPSYPLAGSRRKPLDTAFGEEMLNLEKPDSSRSARAWVHASELASSSTRDAVTQNLEEGEVAILDAHQSLLDLKELLGVSDTYNESKDGTDLWNVLDGNLGIITRNSPDGA